MEILGADVEIESGQDRIRGHWARPSGGEPVPGIVVIPDVFGLSPLYREIAERYARAGVAAVAIDLYSREGAPKLSGPQEALAFIAGLDDRRILGDLSAAARFVDAAPETRGRKVGVTGFCMGGSYALLAACELRDFAASASFYGLLRYAETNERRPRSPLDAAKDLSCPYLGLFGEEDALVPMADVEELRRRLGDAGKRFEIVSYPGAGHAFVNSNRPEAYRPEAAEDALSRATALFRREL